MNQKAKNEEIKITIYQGDENRAKVKETVEGNDFFYKSYAKAALVVKKNIVLADAFMKNMPEEPKGCWGEVKREVVPSEILGYSNSIIVFTAERGWGKTSTMLSFGKMLENENSLSMEFFEQLGVKEPDFHVLSCIDPTSMESGDSILKVIISRMFLSFKERWQKYQNRNNDNLASDAKAKLMQHFQKCYKTIDILKQNIKQEDIYDDLYLLSEIGDSTNLKVELYRLIDEYLQFMSLGSSQKRFLVLQIDDVDLNERMAYEILEDLRKYFMLPNVMIMMAANLKQLRLILERNFAEEYQTSLKYKGSVDIEKCREMGEKYLEKVFPVVSQIHLPNIDIAICAEESNLALEYHVKSEQQEQTKNILVYKDVNEREIQEYQQVLLRLIYEKTGVILQKKTICMRFYPKACVD